MERVTGKGGKTGGGVYTETSAMIWLIICCEE